MKKYQILSLSIILLMICFGCKDDSDDPGIADTVIGLYSGSWTINSMNASGTCNVVKASGTSVDLKMTVAGQSIPTLPGVSLSDIGSNKFRLTYSDSGGTLTGTIQNHSISITLIAGSITETFTGYN